MYIIIIIDVMWHRCEVSRVQFSLGITWQRLWFLIIYNWCYANIPSYPIFYSCELCGWNLSYYPSLSPGVSTKTCSLAVVHVERHWVTLKHMAFTMLSTYLWFYISQSAVFQCWFICGHLIYYILEILKYTHISRPFVLCLT